jgi:hypothetical protein
MQTVEDAQTPLGTDEDETIDEAAMDELFREILAAPPSPSSAPPSLMFDGGEVPRHDPTLADMNADADADEVQREVQRLLDLVPGTGATPELTLDGISSILQRRRRHHTSRAGPWRVGGINRHPTASVLIIFQSRVSDKSLYFSSAFIICTSFGIICLSLSITSRFLSLFDPYPLNDPAPFL